MKRLGWISLALFSQWTFAVEMQIWSDEAGVVTAPYCEVLESEVPMDPRLNGLIAGEIQSADGTRIRVYREDGELVQLRCLTGQQERLYVVAALESPSRGELLIGINAEELGLLHRQDLENSIPQPPTIQAFSTELDLPSGVEVQSGSLDYVVCITGASLNVRDESLNKVIFKAPRYTAAKLVQSFGTDHQTKTIDGVTYTFVKTEFPNLKQNLKIGWVADKYIVTRTECPGAQAAPGDELGGQTWTFPTKLRPSASYKEGMRRFKASRSGGRLHAACDLYRVTGEDAGAITSGTVIRDKYYFYEGTYAIEVKHTGGRVARYGEITGKAAPGIALGKTVKTGQTVGYIGKVNSGCCTPMLHFELYSGTASGALTQSGNAFNRRKDLMDPTTLLTEWEKLKFGRSY